MALLSRISCIHRQFLIFPFTNACSYKEKHFTFKHFQFSLHNGDVRLRKRLKEKLEGTLSSEELRKVYSAFDIVGDIAIIKTAGNNLQDAKAVAERILSIHRNINTVFSQTSPVKGSHRVRELTLLAGENKTTTKYRESGCVFSVDVKKCYFSPRLSYERSRIASQVSPGETVVNMFSGVGCFSVIIAKAVPNTKVYSVDVNPTAYQYMQENVRINRVYGRVIPVWRLKSNRADKAQ